MDFFEAQDNARRKTWQLGLLFALAVIMLIGMTNVIVAAVFLMASNEPIGGNLANAGSLWDAITQVPSRVWVLATMVVVTVVTLASIYKYMMIRGGGRAIAESLGGSRVQSNTTDLKQRRLLNVVEEMAIASGISVPPVYVINEPGINAFAAGYTPDDAVIGITEGALDFLNREELQGVIAHEFSHILNGDTRINIRLIAILFGILFIGLIGNMMLRGSRYRMYRSSRDNGGGVAAIVILGASLAVVGYAGTFFGNLIKAAVSRQREYLADAAAVQYTRDPTGISRALQKIGSAGSRLNNSGANEISHMFFGQAISHFMGNMMATHPPLPKRISAIDPRWNGSFPESLVPESITSLGDTASGFAGTEGVAVEVDTLPEVVGRPDNRSYKIADAIIESTHDHCLEAARDPTEAHLLVYALLLHKGARHPAQTGVLEQLTGGQRKDIDRLYGELGGSDELHRLALLELSVPALKQMSQPQYKDFVKRVVALIKADKSIELFEWVLHRLLLKELTPHFEKPRPPRVRYKKVEQISAQASLLLMTLAHYGHDDAAQANAAYDDAMQELEVASPANRPEVDRDDNFSALNAALRELRDLTPLQKPRLLKACARSVLFDGHINADEGALLQGISAALDCPLPPAVVAKSSVNLGTNQP